MNQTLFQFRREIWMNDMVFRHILVLVSLYLLMALIYHKLKNLPLEENDVHSNYNCQYTCIAIAVVSVIRHATEIVGGYLEQNNGIFTTESLETFCDIIRPIANFALTAGSGLVFLFLWFAHRKFYVNRHLREISNKCLRVFSIATIIVWVLFWISMLIIYVLHISYRFDESGICQYELATGSDWTYGEIIIVWTVASILMHLCLIGLFIYPLAKSAWFQNSIEAERDSVNALHSAIKKALIIALTCFITDLISGGILLIFYKENANTPTFSYSINLVVNHLLTIIWFPVYKKMLWPWNINLTKGRTYKVKEREQTEDIYGTHGTHTDYGILKTISTLITSLLPFLYSSEQSNDRNEASSIRETSFKTISRNENSD